MGKRQDGRIEPGQKLSGAISARAWNRAQDAADIVLGERTGFGAEPGAGLPERLFRSVRLIGFESFQIRFGMIVDISFRLGFVGLPGNVPNFGARPPTSIGLNNATVSSPVAFVDRRITANLNFGVLCGGSSNAGTTSSSVICTHGTCLAMVRKNPGGFLPRVRLPVIRYESDTEQNLRGVAEDSDCGPAELVRWTNIKPFSPGQQQAEGIQSPVSMDDTLENVYYAVVRL